MGLTDKIKDKFAKTSPEDEVDNRLEQDALHESNVGGRTTGTHYVPAGTTTTDNAYSPTHSSHARVPVPGSNANTYHAPGVSTTTNTNTHTTVTGGHRQSPTVPGAYPQHNTGTHIPGTHTTVPGTASYNNANTTGTHSTVPGTASYNNPTGLNSNTTGLNTNTTGLNTNTSGLNTNTSGLNTNTTGTHVPGTASHHHNTAGTALGAGALGAGAGGLAAHERSSHNNRNDPYSSSDRDDFARNNRLSSDATGLKTGPHAHLENPNAIPIAGGEQVGSNVDDNAPMGSTHQHNQHHYGRDASIVGGVGAAGLGAHELNKDHHNKHNRDSYDNRDNRDSYDGKPSTTDKIKSAILPGHKTDDNRTSSGNHSGSTFSGPTDRRHSPSSGTYAGDTFTGDRLRADGTHDQHHYGRDAAIVGGTGAAGVGAYEMNKHHHEHDRNTSGQHYNQTGHNDYNNSPTTTDKIKNALPGNHDNRTTTTSSNYPHDSTLTGSPNTHQQHHYGRDAAVAGGVGTAGVGAYELNKHHHDHNRNSPPLPARRHSPSYDSNRRISQDYTDHTKPSTGEKIKDALIPGRNKEKDSDYRDNNTSTDQHHYGRDAAVVGGVGAAGLGAHELGKDHHNHGKHHSTEQSNLLATTGNTGNTHGLSKQASVLAAAHPPSHKVAAQSVPDMPNDWSMAKRLGGAYEAGYRDAMEHMRAEMKRVNL